MSLNLSREALNLLREISRSQSGEFSRLVFDRTIKFDLNGHTLNDPSSVNSTNDWEQAKDQLLENEFVEELSTGIFRVTKAGLEYANSHLK